MAPLQVASGANLTSSVDIVGGPDAALSWPATLTFLVLMLAGMQGTLGLESADPCRISFEKLRILLGLEIVEVGVVIASEVFSFLQLRAALLKRLQWLQFVAPCVLVIGLVELCLDVYYTLQVAGRSRVFWVPFSAAGGRNTGRKIRIIFELIPLLLTACISLILVGWRQRWWWTAGSVDDITAFVSAASEASLGVAVLAFCVGWALLSTCGVFALLLYTELAEELYWTDIEVIADPLNSKESIFTTVRYMIYPKFYPRRLPYRQITEEHERSFKLLHTLKHGSSANMRELPQQFLEKVRLHYGNAIVGADRDAHNYGGIEGTRFLHVLLLITEHVTILPLLLCVVVAVSRIYDKLDMSTFEALKELADVVIVVSLVEIAIGLKSLLWSHGSDRQLRTADEAIDDTL